MTSQGSTSRLTVDEFNDYNSKIQAAALKATRNAVLLPSDVAFHRSMDPEFSKDLDNFSTQVLGLANRLLSLASGADPNGKGKGKLEDQDDVLDNFHSLVVDSIDQLLEKTDMCLDQVLGRTKPVTVALAAPKTLKASSRGGPLDPALQHASHIPKPQATFKTPVDNTDKPWYPSLPHKFNAQVPLGYHFREAESDMELAPVHPYHYEIKHISYPPQMFETSEPIPVKTFEETPFHWVSTASEFKEMLDALRGSAEIAVDLEHHDYRTYAGFLCLMQISTRQADWIVDLLVVRDEVHALNEIFTDPQIVKVFHGAESDILWLQQNFNVYVVNLFDTYHASKLLEFPKHGLANLLEMYCDFTPDKRYQLADWRIRPLPDAMLQYARSDTHFLLYIYDNLRNALLDRALSRAQSIDRTNSRSSSPSTAEAAAPTPLSARRILVQQVLSRSEETSLRLYQREPYDAEAGSGSTGWDTLARKWNKVTLFADSPSSIDGPNGTKAVVQREVYKTVHAWRDKVARNEDESTRYVLANHSLFKLAEQPPADMVALLRMFPSVPPVLKRRAAELLEVIRACLKTRLDKAVPVSPQQADLQVLEVQGPEPVASDAMLVDAEPATSRVSSNLWSAPLKAPATSTSLLFGSSLKSAASKQASFGTSTSSLFGQRQGATTTSPFSSEKDRVNQVLARIHSSLNIGNIAPTIDVEEIPAVEEVMGMQVEIPFVPASQRQQKMIVDDTVVVVGQRKRKRNKGKSAAEDSQGDSEQHPESSEETSTKKSKVAKVEQVKEDLKPFDFGAAPNILDDAPLAESAKIKRQRKEKKQKSEKTGGSFYGDFPAPPRAHSQLKTGNQSYTFKK
ncbi:hypothetical protein C8J56DRAFT_1006792 [Mycena floridula]|nr:hypothetical protein C8J56DRAFT_1006792 [Mycena floridula]